MAAIILFFSLSLFSAAAASSASSPLSPGPALIKQTCNLATVHYDLCIQALTADPLGRKADINQLAAIALRLAKQNATENAGYIKGLRDRAADQPALQECLPDCVEQYEDAVQQLDASTVALDGKGYNETITWMGAAMADVKACQDGCKEVTDHRNVLTKRNGDFSRLCSITVSIVRSLM